MIPDFIVELARRWYGFFVRFYFAALAAHGERGIRGVAFELKVRAKAAWALFMGAPILLQETVAALTEREHLISAFCAGVLPETYIRERCERYGVPVGSELHTIMLTWAHEVLRHVGREKE